MNIFTKFKETVISVLPVMIIVLFLGLFVVHLDRLLLVRFFTGCIFLIIGLTIFLLGVDLGIQPMGERCGAELTKKRSLTLLLKSLINKNLDIKKSSPQRRAFSLRLTRFAATVAPIHGGSLCGACVC